ncbi:MAG TPA: hypothetical protein PKK07_02810 [bacterium]|nr:hypothetical protein [bacterium]
MVRKLSFFEIDKIRESALKFIERTKYEYGFDLEYFIRNMKNLSRDNIVVIFGDDKEDRVHSAIGFVVSNDIFKDQKIMSELFFHGEGIGGIRCLKEAERWAKENSIEQIIMASTNYNEDRNANYYKRMGYEKDSSTYRKRL